MTPNTQRSTAEHHFLPIHEHLVLGSFLTESGPCRTSNEDSAALVIPEEAAELETSGILALVADGMGGHEGGEVASQLAATVVPESYYRNGEAEAHPVDPKTSLIAAFQAANQRIFSRAAKEHALAGMGTTCTAILLRGGLAWCAHVGDSRVYLVRDRNIYRMTQDHSATMALVSEGLLSLADARHHEDRNVILRAMGTHAALEVSAWKDPFPVRTGDCFLLCSDGLHDSLSDEELGEVCSAGATPQAICEELMALAMEREASDNVTVLVLCVRSAADAGSPAPHPEGDSA